MNDEAKKQKYNNQKRIFDNTLKQQKTGDIFQRSDMQVCDFLGAGRKG